MAKSKGQIVDTSRSGGLTVSQMWQKLFALNEELYEKGERVMDDEDITAAMLLAFPDRVVVQIMQDVAKVRYRYNRGKLPMQPSPPEKRSYRYKNLNARPQRCTSTGVPLPEDEQLWKRPEGT